MDALRAKFGMNINKTGNVIFLNGASSSGKSSIVAALQIIDKTRNWLSIGIDQIIKMAPDHCIGFGPSARQCWYFVNKVDSDGNPIVEIECGPFARQMQKISAQIANTMATIGQNLIIDELLLPPDDKIQLQLYQKALEQSNVHFIGVDCALDQLVEREQLRGNRAIGLARAQYKAVHTQPRFYDFKIDTTNRAPFACAHEILSFISQNPKGKAFALIK